jgi:hypothetical protein
LTFRPPCGILSGMLVYLFNFLTFLAVYLATTSLLDAVADQTCGCIAFRRVACRQRLRILVILVLYSFLLLSSGALLFR